VRVARYQFMMKRSIAALASACLLFALAGCGGGGQSSVPAASSGNLETGSAVLFIPAAAANAAQRIREFVSPSASSVAIAVNAGTAITADISTSSPLCTTGSGGRSCTVPFSAPVGNDTVAITLYAGPNGTGNVLGTGAATASVVAGQPFSVSVAVGGTVASVIVATTGSFTQGTPSSLPVTVSALDAGGNTIIGAAPYGTTITLSDSDTSGSTALSTTTVTSPATSVVLSYNGGAVSGGSVTINASAANVPAGSVTPAQVAVSNGACAPLSTTAHLYVSNDGGGNILQFAPPYTAPGTVLQGEGNPVGVALDNQGNLFVAPFGSSSGTSTAGDIVEYASPYTGAAVATLGAGYFHGPRGIAIDGNRNVFATDSGNNRVLEFAPPYSAAPTVLLNGISSPYGIALSPSCNLFVTTGATVVEYAPPYTGAAVATITSVASPAAIVFDAAGHAFISDANVNKVYEFNAPYTGAAIATTTLPGGSAPLGLALDSANNLFVNQYGSSSIAEYAPPYTGAPVTTVTGGGLSLPAGIAFGP
jgi:sugar lactone lactonase YvrE